MTTLIIGKESNLSKHLSEHIPGCVRISSRELFSDISLLSEFKHEKISIIFNNFQTATQLNDAECFSSYIENSIHITAKVLDYFHDTEISKLIYTSSSSVYGNNIFCNESDNPNPLSLHAALKLSNEKLIEKYAANRQIDYSIARIFNMFGGEDRFSIIHKIIAAYTDNEILTIVNNGNAIRDFIHIDSVVDVYSKLLTARNIPIINIGSGRGTSIRNILDVLKNHRIELQTKTVLRDELKTSTANNAIMVELLGHNTSIDAENYLLTLLGSRDA